jgi:predicted Zn-dependent peptidase
MSRRLRLLWVPILAFLVGGEATAGALSHEKYRLANGLTVILKEEHSLPLVAVNLWFRVGAKEERDGRSGFAHLFEHLMFMGTDRVPTGQFDEIMERGGGSNNASTSLDRTNYFSSGPSSLLPTLLWLEADRLEALGRTMTAAKLEVQRGVVLNEKKESYDNAPYGPVELRIQADLYPPGHPYRWDVIGKDEDIEGATVEDVKDFFSTWYRPNNASLAVVGDFDPAATRALIERLFGGIPAAETPRRRAAEPVRLDGPKRIVVEDKVSLPKVIWAWHSPAIHRPGDAEMDIAATTLGGGRESRLYRRLVLEEGLAQEVDAAQWSQDLGSVFRIDLIALPGADLDRVESVVDEEVARFVAEGPSPEEVARATVRIEAGTVEDLQSISEQADRLNAYEYHFGDPDGLERDMDRYRKATPGSVREWSARVLVPEARLVARVLPDSEEGGGEENPRDERPSDLPPRPFEPPLPEVFRGPGGLVVWHFDRPALPLVAVDLLVRAGSAEDPEDRPGLASLTAEMLREGTGDLDAAAFARAVADLGAEFSAGADRDGAVAHLGCLRSRFDAAWDLFAGAVRAPRMEPADFARVRDLHLAELDSADDEPGMLARRVGSRAYFGPASPYAHPPEGERDGVAAATCEQVREFHARRWRPGGATLLVAGDLRRADLEAALARTWGDWVGEAPPCRAVPRAEPGPLRLLVVDRPDSPQAAVRFLLPGAPWNAPERIGLSLANVALGASFSSRLNSNLRERNSYTYGASSSFVRLRQDGFLLASAQVHGESTGASIREFLHELRRIRGPEPLTEPEAEKARAGWRNGLVESYATLAGLLALQHEPVGNGAGPDSVREDLAAAERVSREEMNRLAASAIDPERGILVLVGDSRAILPQLEGLGLPAPEFVEARRSP